MPVHDSTPAVIAVALVLVACGGPGTRQGNASRAEAHARASGGAQQASGCGDRGCDAIVAVSAGAYHACALRGDHTVRCWGSNTFGQLGDGTRNTRSTATPVMGITDAISIAAGDEFTCAVRAGGMVACWGRNWFGELGIAEPRVTTTPHTVPYVDDATAIVAGHVHACVLRRAGKVACWGSNTHGQAAPSTATPRVPVAAVEGIDDANLLVAGGELTCARRTRGVICWGAILPPPALTAPVSNLVANRRTACARANGEIVCWSTGSTDTFITGVPQVGTGPLLLTDENAEWETKLCAIDASHHIACAHDDKHAPTVISGISDVVQLDAGLRFACGVDTRGDVYCWGDNKLSQLGDGTTAERASAVRVEGLR